MVRSAQEHKTGSVLNYSQEVKNCFSDSIGSNGLSSSNYAANITACSDARDHVRKLFDSGDLPMLSLTQQNDNFLDITEAGQRFRAQWNQLVFIGIGGSSLSGQCLADLAKISITTQPIFLDGLDGDTLDHVLNSIQLCRTGFIVISKSGHTLEPLAQTLVSIRALKEAGVSQIGKHFLAIVEPGKSPLRQVASYLNITTIDHDPKIIGRYSALSPVGMLPALLFGLNPSALRKGADETLKRTLKGPINDAPPAVGAAIAVGLAKQCGVTENVLMTYSDRLKHLGPWYSQLWAESLGKRGVGTTPISARGPADQHSLLQLFLDGPANKFFTLVTTDTAGCGALIPTDLANQAGLEFLEGQRIGDILGAQATATSDTLAEHGRPTRLIKLSKLDEYSVGALFMHFMLETIIAAEMLGVDPFNQPAVEAGKIRAQHYLMAHK
tara:strand:- start:4993 stop:6312 length:1320 start_codon:yes stop_codon:yes gene_type:complete